MSRPNYSPTRHYETRAGGDEQAATPRQSPGSSSSYRERQHYRPPGSWPSDGDDRPYYSSQEREHHRSRRPPPGSHLPTTRIAPPSRETQPSYFGYLISFFTPQPAIIEYSDAEIRRQTKVRKVRIAADDIGCADDGGVRVNAVVSSGSRKRGRMTEETIPIEAKHRRVRDIMKDEGRGRSLEDKYADKIRGAFKKLREERGGGSGGRGEYRSGSRL